MFIDEDIPGAAALTGLNIYQNVCKQDEAIKVDYSDGDECVEENPPTNAETRRALDILKRGVQHRSTNFEKQYEYEQYINELLRTNCGQATINEFFIVIFEINYR
ncbi:hypothetical protein AVEN_62613-1 [Araneus ventricosus]|uniref:Uncharacterized protein n=1 Tax=Araneus ventricosus TaxID=182803 RepID=A0A4Y2U8X0_ARAVE|nr:hypothetical protein AVEN_62613-1 [Araneus ventricosus]